MVDINQLKDDPDFIALSPQAKNEVLRTVDPDFAALSQNAQSEVMQTIGSITGGGPRAVAGPIATPAPASATTGDQIPQENLRLDGTPKGPGFLGTLQRPDGKVSTELSIGVDFDGKENLIPSLVPTLDKTEIDSLLRGEKASRAIVDKAVEHARGRISQGLGPFMEATEGTGPAGTTPAEGTGFELVGLDKQFAEFGTDVKTAIGNVPKSTARFVEDLITPFMGPYPENQRQIAEAIGNLAVGTMEKLIPGKQDKEVFADQMGAAIKERFGSPGAFKKSLIEDPVGVVADIAGLVTGAGAAVRGVGAVSKVKKISDLGRTITKAGVALEPTTLARKTAAGLARPFIPPNLPSKLYQSAAKFSTTLSQQQRKAITNTALDNEIMPTLKGLEKIRGGINDLNGQITQLIDDAMETGRKIPVEDLFKDFAKLKEEAILSGKPISNQRAIDRIRKEITDANKQIERGALTPKEAQQLKQKIYKDNEEYYSRVKDSPASVQAQKAVATQAKDFLEDVFPEIKQLNQKEGALIELRKALDRPVDRISNRDLLGIGIPIKGTVGGVAAGTPGIVAGLALGLLDSPLVKSKLAIVLQRVRRQGIQISPTSGFVALGLFQAGRAKENE